MPSNKRPSIPNPGFLIKDIDTDSTDTMETQLPSSVQQQIREEQQPQLQEQHQPQLKEQKQPQLQKQQQPQLQEQHQSQLQEQQPQTEEQQSQLQKQHPQLQEQPQPQLQGQQQPQLQQHLQQHHNQQEQQHESDQHNQFDVPGPIQIHRNEQLLPNHLNYSNVFYQQHIRELVQHYRNLLQHDPQQYHSEEQQAWEVLQHYRNIQLFNRTQLQHRIQQQQLQEPQPPHLQDQQQEIYHRRQQWMHQRQRQRTQGSSARASFQQESNIFNLTQRFIRHVFVSQPVPPAGNVDSSDVNGQVDIENVQSVENDDEWEDIETSESEDDLDDYEVLLAWTDMIGEARPRGLKLIDIEKLPSYKFLDEIVKSEICQSCVVCLCDYEAKQLLRVLPCAHEFHAECVDRWLQTNRSCPICRHDVKDINSDTE